MTNSPDFRAADPTLRPSWTEPAAGSRVLGFAPERVPEPWLGDVRARLRGLLGSEPPVVALDIQVEFDGILDGTRETRFRITTEPDETFVVTLLRPVATDTNPMPVIICLQGHTSGSYISLGVVRTEEDARDIEKDRDYARQVVARGWAAVVFDQRGFGERADDRPASLRHGLDWRPCHHLTSVALLKGRTLLGERVWDVSRVIDALSSFDGLDLARIGCVGDSTGGTIAYFAAAMDPRIAATMPAAYVCTFASSIMQHDHCEDHYLPGFMQSFELSISPRSSLLVRCRRHWCPRHFVPARGCRAGIRRDPADLRLAGSGDACRLVIGLEDTNSTQTLRGRFLRK